MGKALRAIFLSALLVAAFAGCSKGKSDAPSSKEIMRKYGETLATSPDRARDAAGKEEDRAAKEERAIKELEN